MAKRGNGEGTIRLRADGRWEGRYTQSIDPASGKQIQKSVYGKSQGEVRRKLTKISSEIDDGIYVEPSKLSLGVWLDLWLKEYNGDIKPTTLDQYNYQVRIHLKPGLGNVRIQELTAPMVQSLYNRLQQPYEITQKMMNGKEKKVSKPGLSPKSIKNLHGVLHEALDQAMKLGYIRYNVTDAVILPRVKKPEMHPIVDENVSKFLTAIKGHKFEDMFYVVMFSGLRQGEALGLTWDCIDFDRSTITIYRQLQRERKPGGEYQFVSLKNDKSRTFKLAPDVLQVLKRIKTKQNESKLRLGKEWNNKDGFVFTDEFGNHLSKATTYENFKRCVEQAGIPVTRFHDLRHTFATLELQQGIGMKTVSESLGHATTAFTMDVYGHVSEQMQDEAAGKLQTYLESLQVAK